MPRARFVHSEARGRRRCRGCFAELAIRVHFGERSCSLRQGAENHRVAPGFDTPREARDVHAVCPVDNRFVGIRACQLRDVQRAVVLSVLRQGVRAVNAHHGVDGVVLQHRFDDAWKSRVEITRHSDPDIQGIFDRHPRREQRSQRLLRGAR